MSSLLFGAATVVDGTGAPRYDADVLVRGGRIERIARPHELPASSADRTFDARGLVLSPGFIDMHAHSDLAVLADGPHLAKLGQGVTTEVVGQDGLGYAPVDDTALSQIRRQIAGWNGNPDELHAGPATTGRSADGWYSVDDYLRRIEDGSPTNIAYLVPQGNLRMLAVGQDDRPATRAELDTQCALLRDGLLAGAVGLSSGLTYTPGMYAGDSELEALCTVVAEHGGYYAPHTRSYGVGALDAYAEVIAIARHTGCGLHLTHATLNFATNRANAAAFLGMIDAARADGVDLTLDSYPYLPGATTLAALLPSWFASGGPDALLARLELVADRPNGAERARLVHSLDVVGSDGFHGEIADWSLIEITGVVTESLEHYVGRTVAQIAADEGREPVDVVAGILLTDELATSILMHIGHEHNVRAIMADAQHCGGSDGILVGSKPHPRAWGTFARYLCHYVRELGVLSLEECIRHLAGTPARRLSLRDRGLIREGYAADLVLFDAGTIRDAATFEQPRQQADGITAVVVNGSIAVENGHRTAARAGIALRAHAAATREESATRTNIRKADQT